MSRLPPKSLYGPRNPKPASVCPAQYRLDRVSDGEAIAHARAAITSYGHFGSVENVRYLHKVDYQVAPHMSAFGGKADMPFCTAHVCF